MDHVWFYVSSDNIIEIELILPTCKTYFVILSLFRLTLFFYSYIFKNFPSVVNDTKVIAVFGQVNRSFSSVCDLSCDRYQRDILSTGSWVDISSKRTLYGILSFAIQLSILFLTRTRNVMNLLCDRKTCEKGKPTSKFFSIY